MRNGSKNNQYNTRSGLLSPERSIQGSDSKNKRLIFGSSEGSANGLSNIKSQKVIEIE